MSYHFKISVQSVDDPDAAPLDFQIESHDNLIATVDRVRSANVVSEEEAPALAIGLKLLGEVLIRRRDEPMFQDLWKAVSSFIKRLKAR